MAEVPKSIDVWICPECGMQWTSGVPANPWERKCRAGSVRHRFVLAEPTDEQVRLLRAAADDLRQFADEIVTRSHSDLSIRRGDVLCERAAGLLDLAAALSTEARDA